MRLYNIFLVAVVTLIIGIHGLPTTAAHDQAKSQTMTAPDTDSSVRSPMSRNDGTSTNKLRGADSTSPQDEERGILSSAKVRFFLKLGYNPQTASKHLSEAQMKKFYYKWLVKTTAKKAKTNA
ncbi:hypothetical protein F442_21822 [Phytophthora nicotianae P10297]|uniref:RxLR effector protein n=4 Tax=Phytophthora nicotianae TaxID=4792 RepID=W2Y449_PHYNI|nr:hypothetical protein L917_21083 [Phytophthora nicotianae]ETM31317.1 hypothetical protein L914_21092 [Phytophthora nicotianae]ETP28954.1 hypothetical protein F442_21822 [Phytophthora nicotianae P10297]